MLAACDKPVILHWLGEMFDPQLAGYWGSDDFDGALDTVVQQLLAQVEEGCWPMLLLFLAWAEPSLLLSLWA